MSQATVADFLKHVRAMERWWYLWGGKGEYRVSPTGVVPAPYQGVDCSGLVTRALYLAGGPDWRFTHSTDQLWVSLPSVAVPRAGDLAFYAAAAPAHEQDVEHVMVLLDATAGTVFGACKGGHLTVTEEIARQQGAFVRAQSGHLYRTRFCGWRRLPLKE